MGFRPGPPSKVHDPIGYERYYQDYSWFWWLVAAMVAIFVLRGC
jgi:hypothetical protein